LGGLGGCGYGGGGYSGAFGGSAYSGGYGPAASFSGSAFAGGSYTGTSCGGGTLARGNEPQDGYSPNSSQQQVQRQPPSATMPPPQPTYSKICEGIVTQFELDKGWGFITVTDGRRAYVHNSECGGQPLNVGQKVVAVLTTDPKNPSKWMGTKIQRTTTGVAAVEGRLDGMVVKWESKGYGFIRFEDGREAYVHVSSCGGRDLVKGELVSAILAADPKKEGRFCALNVSEGPIGDDGTIAQWNEDKGYGFVQLDDGRRAFLHRSAFGAHATPSPGWRLRVLTRPDGKNPGKWQVSVVKATNEEPLSSLSPEGALEGERLTGVVEKWEARGYGFLKMEDGRSAYMHISQSTFGEPKEGETVSAVLYPDKRKEEDSSSSTGRRWAAHDIMQGPYLGETGVVKEWHSDKGYGFLHLLDGRRVYVHRVAFGGSGDLIVGQQIQVRIKADPQNPEKFSVSKVVSKEPLPGIAES